MGVILRFSPELNRFWQKAPFVTKREQEIAAIQEATAAALEVPGPVRHKRYLDNAERAGSIQEMVVSCYCQHMFHVFGVGIQYILELASFEPRRVLLTAFLWCSGELEHRSSSVGWTIQPLVSIRRTG